MKPCSILFSVRKTAAASGDEPSLVRSGKPCTRDLTFNELFELLRDGKVKGYKGHHINSARAFPELANNPNNIEFLMRNDHFGANT